MKRSIDSIDTSRTQIAGTVVAAVDAVAGQAGAALASLPQAQHEPRRRSSQQAVGYYTSGSYLARSRRGGSGSRPSMFRIS